MVKAEKVLLKAGLLLLAVFILLFIPAFQASAYDEGDLKRLHSSNNCVDCDLSQADLRNEDLLGKNMSGANLIGACLIRSYMVRTNLSGAKLNGARLKGADLKGADLSGAKLYKADLSEASLAEADLSGAFLWEAKFKGADMRGVILRGVNLNSADLRNADLEGADLKGAYLGDANLNGANLCHTIMPEGDENNSGCPRALSQTESTAAIDDSSGEALYGKHCSSCHNKLASSQVKGASHFKIKSQIALSKKKEHLKSLSNRDIISISNVLEADSTDGATLYKIHCEECHKSLDISENRGTTAYKIEKSIRTERKMDNLKSLPYRSIKAIAEALNR